MKIAIEGCAHGDLDKIYETLQHIENREQIKVDLLICCGDFQSVRNKDDMNSMAVPPKYREMKDFHQYYNGSKKAPVLTLFIGGNHESANYLWELPYGGWVADNIFYMGYAGVINFAGLRIGGLSGIFKQKDYYKGHFESPPFNEETKRSFYHVRSLDVAKLKLMNSVPFDVFLSHDWPKRIYHHGDCQQLIRFKPFLKDEINTNTLGSDAAEDLLNILQPTYWFSGHMHAKFSALVQHSDPSKTTRFLALDKCLPRRNFLQVIDVGEMKDEPVLSYDKYWIATLQATNETFSKSSKQTFLTEFTDEYKPTEKKAAELEMKHESFKVFPFEKSINGKNQQTALFCDRFQILNPCESTNSVVQNNQSGSSRFSVNNQGARRKKLVLAKPKQTKTVPQTNINQNKNTEDDFSDLTNPNTSSNPDEIDISDDNEEDGSDSDSDKNSDKDDTISNEDVNKSSFLNQSSILTDSSVTELPSFIETPLPYKKHEGSSSFDVSSSEISSSNILTSDDNHDMMTPVAKKKFKLVRRNQNIYTNDEGDDS